MKTKNFDDYVANRLGEDKVYEIEREALENYHPTIVPAMNDPGFMHPSIKISILGACKEHEELLKNHIMCHPDVIKGYRDAYYGDDLRDEDLCVYIKFNSSDS